MVIRPNSKLIPRAKPHLPNPWVGQADNQRREKTISIEFLLLNPSSPPSNTENPGYELPHGTRGRWLALSSVLEHHLGSALNDEQVAALTCASRVPFQRLVLYFHRLSPLPPTRYHDELFVAPGISIMMIDTSLSKRTFLIDFAAHTLPKPGLFASAHLLTLATPGLQWLDNVGHLQPPISTVQPW